MAHYYVSRQPQANGDHEVHMAGCTRIPGPEQRDYLGEFVSCYSAVKGAEKRYPRVNGCGFCSEPCHTR